MKAAPLLPTLFSNPSYLSSPYPSITKVDQGTYHLVSSLAAAGDTPTPPSSSSSSTSTEDRRQPDFLTGVMTFLVRQSL